MQIIFYEAKKMLFHQKGFLFILLSLLLMMIALVLGDNPANSGEELYGEEYSFYMNQLEGVYTPEKELFLEEEAKRILTAKITLQKLYNDYYDGKISEAHFKTNIEECEKIIKNERGFEVIYEQLLYIKESPENRYFMKTNGWNGILADKVLDLFLTVTILLLITPVFCYEYESKMDILVLTSEKGEKSYTLYKYFFALFAVAILCIINFIFRYCYYDIKYGLYHGDFPYQSLKFFGTSTKNISVMQAFLAISAIRTFGYLFFAQVIMFISNIVRKYSITVFFCAALILLPYFGLEQKYINLFPLPLAFMIATGFFEGNKNKWDQIIGENILVYKEISSTRLMLLVFSSMVICCLIYIFLFRQNKNIWNRLKIIKNLKIGRMIIFISVSVFFLSACSGKIQEKCLFNSSQRMSYETDDYRCYVDESDMENIRLVIENKITGEKNNLIRNPIKTLIREEQLIFGKGRYVYYMIYNVDKSQFRGENVDKVRVYELNLDTFKEKVIFEKNIGRSKDYFLGLNPSENLEWQFLNGTSAFFMNDDYLYFVGNDLRQVSRLTGNISVIDVPVNRNYAFDGENIYYINEKLILSKYNTKSKKYMEIPDIVTSYFILTDTEILYVNRADNHKIYVCNLKNHKITKLTDTSVQSFTCDQDYIYYLSNKDGEQHKAARKTAVTVY